MEWRSASSARQFRLLNQTLTLHQVAEFRRTRRVKEGTGSSASVSAAFGPVGPIHPGYPGLGHRRLKNRRLLFGYGAATRPCLFRHAPTKDASSLLRGAPIISPTFLTPLGRSA